MCVIVLGNLNSPWCAKEADTYTRTQSHVHTHTYTHILERERDRERERERERFGTMDIPTKCACCTPRIFMRPMMSRAKHTHPPARTRGRTHTPKHTRTQPNTHTQREKTAYHGYPH